MDDPRTLRTWSRMIASLLRATGDELKAFRDERFDEASGITEEQLERGRALLIAVARAVEAPTEERWRVIDYAATTVEDAERTASAPAVPGGAPSPIAPAPAPRPPPASSTPGSSPWAGAHAAPSPSAPSPGAPSPGAPSPGAPPPVIGPSPAVGAPPVAPPPVAPSAPAAVVVHEAGPEEGLLTTAPVGATIPKEIMPFLEAAKKRKTMGDPPSSPGSQPSLPKVTPFDAPAPDVAPSSAPAMDLETYARLCVERRLWPADEAGRNARYGVDEAEAKRLDESFGEQFRNEPTLYGEFRSRCDAYEHQLRNERG